MDICGYKVMCKVTKATLQAAHLFDSQKKTELSVNPEKLRGEFYLTDAGHLLVVYKEGITFIPSTNLKGAEIAPLETVKLKSAK